MNDIELQQYASLIVNKGVNLQTGQGVIIYSSSYALELVNYIEKEALNLGAAIVIKRISDENIIKEGIEHLDELDNTIKEDISNISSFVRIRIRSEGLHYLSDIDVDKLRRYNEYQRNKDKEINLKVHQWTIVPFLSEEWAKDIFPDIDNPKEHLWSLIKKVVRLEGNPIDNWDKHNKKLHDRCDYLNSLNIKSLHYRSESSGTDFNVSLNPMCQFIGGSTTDINGVEYICNMPTEEVYTSPDMLTANGVVYSTKPLYLYGQVYKDFGFRFKDGKIIEVIGDDGVKYLFQYIFDNIHDSNKLGELALVPSSSPISMLDTLFYKNLIDENASCHLALGDGILDTVKDLNMLSKEELESIHINKSSIHIDFMIGANDLEIIAELGNNKTIKLFENGDWAND